jgi:glycerophosphoryl diester phosphodiesterase
MQIYAMYQINIVTSKSHMTGTFLYTTILLLMFFPVSGQEAGERPPMKFLAHRGASYQAPENTLASITLAWELGAYGAECDVMLTADKKVILSHDQNLKRLTGQNLLVRENSWEDLSSLVIRLSETNLPEYANEPIPLLGDVLATIPDDRMLVIEIKTGPEILSYLKKVVDDHWKSGMIAFIAFDFETIRLTKSIYPDVPCYYLSMFRGKAMKRIDRAADCSLDGLDLRYGIINRKLVEKCGRAGLDLWCWTVNDPETAIRMQDLGVKVVTTDRPDWLKERVSEQSDHH